MKVGEICLICPLKNVIQSKLAIYTCYVRYGDYEIYHPDIANGMYDWDNELFEIMPRVVNIKSKKKEIEY